MKARSGRENGWPLDSTNGVAMFARQLDRCFVGLCTGIAEEHTVGTAVITEKIYENRMQHVAELQRMGASIRLQGNTAVVEGVTQLSAAPVNGSDLRAAAAMVIAALKAQGTSRVSGLNHLDRGYDAIEAKLTGCGAQLQRWNP